ARARRKLPKSSFALTGGRYPIHDASHARNALARVAQHGTPAEQAKVRSAVPRRYPGIGQARDTRKRQAMAKAVVRRKARARGVSLSPGPSLVLGPGGEQGGGTLGL